MKFSPYLKSRLIKELSKRNISFDELDLVALWDSSLSYHENQELLFSHLEGQPTIQEFSEYNLSSKSNFWKDKSREVFFQQLEQLEASKLSWLDGLPKLGEEEKLILTELENFNPHLLRSTLSSLAALNQKMNVVNISVAGMGKSRSSIELMQLLDLPFEKVTGHHSPMNFFQKLSTPQSIMVIDESATLLRNPEILNLLLSALWEKRVQWQHDFVDVSCAIIFNTNSMPSNAFSDALKDRCLFNKIDLESVQIKEKLLHEFSPNKDLWASLSSRLKNNLELDEKEKQAINEIIKLSNPKSVRFRHRLEGLAKFCKSVFNSLEPLKYFLEFDYQQFILESDLNNSDKVKLLAQKNKLSIRQAQRIVKDFDDQKESLQGI